MEPFLAMIVQFGGNFAPRGWAFCDGQLLPIASYSAVFSLLGTTYGGDGRTTFGLPDLRGRSAVHAGNGPGLATVRLGEKGGAPSFSLTTAQMPSHSHVAAAASRATHHTPTAGMVPANGTGFASGAVAGPATGGGQAVNHRSPFQSVNFIIALQGTFPSRS